MIWTDLFCYFRGKSCVRHVWRIVLGVLPGFLVVATVYAADPLSRLPTGKAAKVDGELITIDSRFIEALSSRPSRSEWNKNYWELIYFINLGHLPAIDAGIDVLSTFVADRPYDDHDDPAILARALSERDEFWLVLSKKPLATRKRIVDFFDKNQNAYVGGEGYQSERAGLLK